MVLILEFLPCNSRIWTTFPCTLPIHLYTFDPTKKWNMSHFGYNKKSKLVVEAIQALCLKLDQFVYNLGHHSPYEVILYIWIQRLYLKGKSSEDAVQLIYKAKKRYLLKHSCGVGNVK